MWSRLWGEQVGKMEVRGRPQGQGAGDWNADCSGQPRSCRSSRAAVVLREGMPRSQGGEFCPPSAPHPTGLNFPKGRLGSSHPALGRSLNPLLQPPVAPAGT